jgi:hypothetical protein
MSLGKTSKVGLKKHGIRLYYRDSAVDSENIKLLVGFTV